MNEAEPFGLPLVGRDTELARLRTAVDSASIGAVVCGAAGVGKSRLCAELAEQLCAAAVPVISVAATRSGRAIPFGAFASVLGSRVGATAASPNARYEVLAAALDVLRTAHGPRRFVLTVDDAQLLDDASATLLHLLATSNTAFAVMTIRYDEPAPDAVDALWRDERMTRIDLEPLRESAVAELCTKVLGGRIEAPTRRRLYQVSGGNLLYLRELLLAGRQSGALALRHDVWSWDGALEPGERLGQLVDARLHAASPDVERALELLAVGDAVELEALLRMLPPETVEAAEAGGYVDIASDGRRSVARPAHPLMGEVLRARMTELNRRRTARELADAIAAFRGRRSSDLLRVAALELMAGDVRTPNRLVAAAVQARRLGDLELGERLARAAFDSGAGAPAAAELDACLVWQGRFDEVGHHDPGSDPSVPLDVVAYWARNRASALFFGAGDATAANALLEETEARLGTDPVVTEVRSHRAELAMFAAELTDAERLARDVLDAEPAPVVARATAFGALVPTLALGGRVDDAATVGDVGLEWLLSQPEPPLWEGAGIIVGQFLAALIGGRLGAFEPMVAELYEEAAGKPLDPMRGVWALMLGRSASASGALGEACERLREAAELLRAYDPGRVLAWCLGALAQSEGQRGEAAAARAAVDEMERAAVPAVQAFAVDVQLGRAWAEASAGELDEARRLAIEGAEDARARGAFGAAGYALHTAFRFGATGTSPDFCRLAPHLQGPLLAAAREIAASPRDPRALLDQADVLSVCSMHLWAAELAATAAALATSFEETSLRTRAVVARDRELEHCDGASTPALSWSRARISTESLTAREVEIGRLAASGLSNPEIAQRLTVSRRTVENHLAAAYRKLGVTSRMALGVLLGGPSTD